jgi:uncharacterized membrane protein YwzB
MEKETSELTNLIYKILVPTIAGISIKLGIMIKDKKITLIRVISSLLTSIGIAIATGEFFIDSFEYHYAMICIVVTVSLSEKISFFLMHKLNIEDLISGFLSHLQSKFKK